MALKVGVKAPDFTLPSFTPSKDLTQISLDGMRGKNIVLLFFPQAFTGVCTTEMCTMSENFDVYKGMDADVLGISVDGTFVQKAFAEKNNIKMPLLSDFNREVVKLYDVMRPEFAHGMKGTAERAVYVIDKDGVIRYIEVMASPGDMVNFEGIKSAVESLK
ncbi:MAG: peroxiredoxin [Chlorobi bacterium]|nr:peroxiredoxin [Chlorobiota bacterium]MCI0716135.1 peroxiredoxin [Chlorobiota bacterium]